MFIINRDLIPNKQVLSIGCWDNCESEEMFLSVTRGMATSVQKQNCYQQFVNELAKNEMT